MSKRHEPTGTNQHQPVLAGTRWDEKFVENFSARLGHLTQELHHHQAEVAAILGISHARVEQLEARGI